MAQLGRVTNSFFSGIAEATLALANVNFDFSLIKVRRDSSTSTGTDGSEVNAPVEFEGVGKALSNLRRDVAESGSTHITARKLGAVFETVIPPTPKLYEAYGCRASEICQHYKQNERVSKRAGLFAEFSGPDATSIWAAATSGKAAIAVHLLACLLARFWKPAEAISIWEEIIGAHKKILEGSMNAETFQMAPALASQVSLTRQQLAEWDNSARAWLGFADRSREDQQTKLKLVIDDIQQPIAARATLYESVMDTWTIALGGMEELLKGSSQGVSHSGLILALSSWHLYPDISTNGGAPILQNDKLFPHGTTLFLNLQGNPNTSKRGIYWSLSLSQMRFYGAPIQTERSYATDSSRISFTQFLHAVLGSASSQWAIKSPPPLDVARIIKMLLERFGDKAPAWMKMLGVAAEDMLRSTDSTRLLNLKLYRVGQERGSSMLAGLKGHPLPVFGLAEPSLFLRCVKDPEYKLMILRKYAHRFFPMAQPHEIILKIRLSSSWDAQFAAAPPENFDDEPGLWTKRAEALQAQVVTNDDDDNVVDIGWQIQDDAGMTRSWDVPKAHETFTESEKDVRNLVSATNEGKSPLKELKADKWDYLGKYFSEESEMPKQSADPDITALFADSSDVKDSSTQSNKEENLLAGTKAQSPVAAPKDGCVIPEIILTEIADEANVSSDYDERVVTKAKDSRVTNEVATIEYITASPLEGAVADYPKSYVHWSDRKPRHKACLQLGGGHHFNCQLSNWIFSGGTPYKFELRLSLFKSLNCMVRSELPEDRSSREYFFGDLNSGAMFVSPALVARFKANSAGPKWAQKSSARKEIDLADIEHALAANEMDMFKWTSEMENAPWKLDTPYYRSLNALSSAWQLYTDLGPATVDSAVLSGCVTDSAWTKGTSFGPVVQSQSKVLSRGEAFACIAEFETSGIDLASSEFEAVMAISIGESIFVAGPLLTDPCETQEPSKIIRLNGNVGKSGLVLMVPPAEPMISTPDPDSWRVIEREEYKGQVEDCFSKTSLHLSFTDWSVPINTGASERGRRSAEASLVETLVSVFSYGRWIGDLDVLTALRRGCSQPDHEFFYCHSCNHDLRALGEEQLYPDGIVAIRSWDEFLDRPNSPAVVMAHGNWEARLAVTAMGVARGDRVFISRGTICQECLRVLETFGGSGLINRALFIA